MNRIAELRLACNMVLKICFWASSLPAAGYSVPSERYE